MTLEEHIAYYHIPILSYYSKEELNKNRIFTAKTGSLLYSCKICEGYLKNISKDQPKKKSSETDIVQHRIY